MKITKSQLRKIIKEEISNELGEGAGTFLRGETAATAKYTGKEAQMLSQLKMRIQSDHKDNGTKGKFGEIITQYYGSEVGPGTGLLGGAKKIPDRDAEAMAIQMSGAPGFSRAEQQGGAVTYDPSSFTAQDRADQAAEKRKDQQVQQASGTDWQGKPLKDDPHRHDRIADMSRGTRRRR